MLTLYSSAAYGHGGKQYIARIIGRHPGYTFDREFIGRKGGKRNEACEADVDEQGLYECRSIDNKGRDADEFVVILGESDDELKEHSVDKETAMKIARALKDRDIDHICDVDADGKLLLMTESQSRRHHASKTIDNAVEQCMTLLNALPSRYQRRVLTALRKAVNTQGK